MARADRERCLSALENEGFRISSEGREQLLSLFQAGEASSLGQSVEGSMKGRQSMTDLARARQLCLDSDICKFGLPCLPDDIGRKERGTFREKWVLQVVSSKDVATSGVSSLDTIEDESAACQKRRMLRIQLTDGKRRLVLVEHRHCPILPTTIIPGTKVLLTGVQILQGIGLLAPSHISVLGGRVTPLAEAWEAQQHQRLLQSSSSSSSSTRKKASASDPTPPSSRISDDSRPPAFQGLHGSSSSGSFPETPLPFPDGGNESSFQAKGRSALGSIPQTGKGPLLPQKKPPPVAAPSMPLPFTSQQPGGIPSNPTANASREADAVTNHSETHRECGSKDAPREETGSRDVPRDRGPRDTPREEAGSRDAPREAGERDARLGTQLAGLRMEEGKLPAGASQRLLERKLEEASFRGRGRGRRGGGRRGKRGRHGGHSDDYEEDSGSMTLEEWERRKASSSVSSSVFGSTMPGSHTAGGGSYTAGGASYTAGGGSYSTGVGSYSANVGSFSADVGRQRGEGAGNARADSLLTSEPEFSSNPLEGFPQAKASGGSSGEAMSDHELALMLQQQFDQEAHECIAHCAFASYDSGCHLHRILLWILGLSSSLTIDQPKKKTVLSEGVAEAVVGAMVVGTLKGRSPA